MNRTEKEDQFMGELNILKNIINESKLSVGEAKRYLNHAIQSSVRYTQVRANRDKWRESSNLWRAKAKALTKLLEEKNGV